MHIVADTNVLARAARRGSLAAKVVSQIVAGPHLLVLSPTLLSELARVLRYPRMFAVHGLDDQGIDAFVVSLQTAALLVKLDPSDIIGVVKNDPDDDRVLATAVVGRAQVLCTRDTDFNDPGVLAYCQQHGLRVMTDLDLLRSLGSGTGP